MSKIADEILMHYGMPRRSGRYPWGSGEDPYQRTGDFLSRIETLKKSGWEETPENIKKEFGLTTTQYRAQKSIANSQRRQLEVARAKSLREDGLGYTEIGRRMGIRESTVRSLLNEKSETRMKQAEKTADTLEALVKKEGMLDVGAGAELELGVSKERLNQSLNILKDRGYHVYGGRVDQVTNAGKKTTLKVLCTPEKEHREIFDHPEDIKSIKEYVSHDGGDTFDTFVYPKSMNSSRMMVRYRDDVGPDGVKGIDKDGIIEIRRGVDDLSLGNQHYAQVRILVDGTHYVKGMAVYSDDLPDGVDMVFNTNKTSDVPALGSKKSTVLKPIKDDPDNPFGSLIKAGGQSYYIDKDGNRQLSLINKTREEGDWDEWSNKLPSQFLSKQSISMARKQLDLALADKQAEYEAISELNNPTVKKHLLNSFAEDCDKAAVQLHAAALPGQKYHVIIPVNSLKDDEVYAPGYEDGTKLALVRYPHGGTFEIPILTVNNKNAVGQKYIGDKAIDAVGVNSKVAERLSGADFDGDTVMCIPTHDKGGKVKVTSTPPLKGLEGFDPKTAYPEREGMKYMTKGTTQKEMGVVSNLITDMTLKGASQDELARAVRHSMVVIDAEKHKLDYKRSEEENGIAALKRKYQGHYDENGNYHEGSSTLISRAKSQTSVDKRQGTPKVNQKDKPWYDPDKPEGSLIYKTADDIEYTYTKTDKRTGEVTYVTKRRSQQSTRMAETDDAYSLVSDANTPMERLYADYANNMKALANKARLEAANTGKIAYSKTARETYSEEVRSLDTKLATAQLNAPRERRAQLLANAEIRDKKEANPDMTKSDIRKASQQALTKYRKQVDAKREPIEITDREWEAIQAGAVSENTLSKILKYTNIDKLRERATPRAKSTLSKAQVAKIKAMSNSNYTISDIAKALGVSTSTVSKYLKGAN